MKITSIRIIGLQQFGDVFLDFTHPETKEPLDKICFIGQNGTGKSTILKILYEFIDNDFQDIVFHKNVHFNTFVKRKIFDFISIGVSIGNEKFYICTTGKSNYTNFQFVLNAKIDNIENWVDLILNEERDVNGVLNSTFLEYTVTPFSENNPSHDLRLKHNSNDLLIYCPSESNTNTYLQITDVPSSDLNEAQQLFTNFSFSHVVSDEKVTEFWKLLIYLIKKRDGDRNIFENEPENINKTKKELIEEFEILSPKILDGLAQEWNKILNKTGLYFDANSANNPIQLHDNLKAYIKHKTTNERIEYNQLSTGIRNFIFKIGHIYSLYFNRKIDNGFLFFDEPENSLFPDFLFELVKTLQTIVLDKNKNNNTQLFVSTHNPIVAAQFEPYERIVFSWNETNTVTIKKGTSPIGDDPNDVLSNDFKLKNLMGEAGIQKWEEYVALKKQLARDNSDNKDELISKILEIGKEYNF